MQHHDAADDEERRGNERAEGPAPGVAHLADAGSDRPAAVAVGRASTGEPPEEVDPVYGFPGVTGDVDPPVEADHRVTLGVRDRGGDPAFAFDPVGLAVDVGDTVRFEVAEGSHAVAAYHPLLQRTRRVPGSSPAFSSPLLTQGSYWLYTFDHEGVHDAFCLTHEWAGMVVRVVVGGDADAEGGTARRGSVAQGGRVEPPTADGEGPPYPPSERARVVFCDPAMTPAAIRERGRVSWADLSTSPDAETGRR